jgi:hypothetical protein
LSDAAADDETPVPEVARDAYDQIEAENYSRLKLLEKSPAHYKAGYGEATDALKLGIACHMAILEPAKFEAEYVVYPGKVRRGKEWEAFEQNAIRHGKTVVSRSEKAKTIGIRDAVHANKRAMEYLSGGKPEVTLQWEIAHFKCKGRADYVGAAVVDVKSTQCSSPAAFAQSFLKYGYDMQAAWYSDGLRLSTGEDLPFKIIAVESSPPHMVTVFDIPKAIIAQGRERYLTLLGKLDWCRKTGVWGGYTETEEVELELPSRGGWTQSEE